MGLFDFLTGKKKKDSQKTGQQDAVEMKEIASQIRGLKAVGNQGMIESIESDDSSVFGEEEEQEKPEDLFSQYVIPESGGSNVISKEVPKKGGAFEEWEHIDRPTNAIEYERVPDKVREMLTEKKAGELRALLADKSSQEGIEAIREKYNLTKEDMKNPDAVPRMTEPYFRAAISELSKDKTLPEEQQKALSDFSEEMDQQMMINAMKAPNEEQIENLWRAFLNGEENEQMAREFKAKGMQKVLFGGEGVIENLKNRYRPPVPGLGDAGAKMVEEKKRQKESARSLLKIFLMLQIGKMQKRETDKKTGIATDSDWNHNMSDLFAHGGRIMIETGGQSADPEKKDSVGDVMASVFPHESALEKRGAATHYIAEGEMGEFKEKRKYGAAVKSAFDSSWGNYGLPVAVGGSGSKGPLMLDEEAKEKNQVIRTDHRNGHLYIGKKEGSEKKHGGFLIGLESEGTYRMSQWGHIHTATASAGRISSTGGMKEDLHGDKTSGRNLYLGGMKNKDLIRIMQEVNTGFDELYDSEDEEKQKEYDEILRKLTGKKLEAEEVEDILRKLTQKDELGISVGKIREAEPEKIREAEKVEEILGEFNEEKPILSEELMAESEEEPELTDEQKKEWDERYKEFRLKSEEREKELSLLREERDKKLDQFIQEDPKNWHRFEVEEAPEEDQKKSMQEFLGIVGESSEGKPVDSDSNDMVHRFLEAQGKTLDGVKAEAEERAKKRKEEKEKSGDPYADVPFDVGPLFYEDDKSPEATKEYEEANRLAAEKLKKAKGGDQVYDPEKVGQEWLYDRDEDGKYYSAQVSSDPTHFGKHHKLDTSAYLILADQVIRVDDYIAGRSTPAEEKAVKETKPEPEKEASKEKVSGETALVPFGIKVLNLTEAMQKNCMDGIEKLQNFMMTCAPEEDKKGYELLFKSIRLYEQALFTGQLAEQGMKPDDIFRFIPLESTMIRGSYDLGKLMETGITTDQLQALRQSLEITDTVNPAVSNLCKAVAVAQKAIVEAKVPKRLLASGDEKEKKKEKKKEKTRGLKLILDNPFHKEPEEKKETIPKETIPKETIPKEKPDVDFDFDFNSNLEDLSSEEPKPEEKKDKKPKISMNDFFKTLDEQKKKKKEEMLPKGKDIGTDIDLEKQITGASCYAYVAAALLRHFGKKYGLQGAESVIETDFPKAYGVKRIWDGQWYPRGENEEHPYQGYKIKEEEKEGLRTDFPDITKNVGRANRGLELKDIVEAIHQMSGGKAALNSETFDTENIKSVKKTVVHILNDRKMPADLNLIKKGVEGHHILVVEADEEGYSYRDPFDPEKLKKEKWDSFEKNYSRGTISFLQHMQEISPEGNGHYRPLPEDDSQDSQLERMHLYPDDYMKHLEHIDAYKFNDNNYSYYSLLPKKEVKKK